LTTRNALYHGTSNHSVSTTLQTKLYDGLLNEASDGSSISGGGKAQLGRKHEAFSWSCGSHERIVLRHIGDIQPLLVLNHPIVQMLKAGQYL